MAQAACSAEEFIAIFEANGSAGAAEILGTDERAVLRRRRNIEKTIGRPIISPGDRLKDLHQSHPEWLKYVVKNGYVLIGSDAHYWPKIVTTAHKGFVAFAKKLQPKLVIMNGDVFDGARISRFPPMGWAENPSVKDEIECCQERLFEIERAAPNAKRAWPLGNHDARFERLIATQAPELAGVKGVALKDSFPYWEPCWSACINDEIVVKHRFKGGIHAVHNNTLWAGKSIITGHLHSLKVSPFSDYNGTRWGVDCGTLAEPYGPQFDYTEQSPANWRSGFVVLKFVDGVMLQPQLALVIGKGKIDFCNEVHRV